jgi:NitT/TauT family transport system ATP-binding protein
MSVELPIYFEASDEVLGGANLAFGYAQKAIFHDVTIHIQRREIVALLGCSGCGKSTLLRVLAGLQAPDRGEVSFLGQPLCSPHPRSALLFQQASLLPWLTVAGNVGFGLNFKHQPHIAKQEQAARIDHALSAVGLANQGQHYPAQMSGGMAQRVALARALAREPELLFADEPFSALDAITRAEMQALLVDVVHRWNTAVLLVTHDIDEAILVADRILLMGEHPGRIVREWNVAIPQPRDSQPEAVNHLRLDILQALRTSNLYH